MGHGHDSMSKFRFKFKPVSAGLSGDMNYDGRLYLDTRTRTKFSRILNYQVLNLVVPAKLFLRRDLETYRKSLLQPYVQCTPQGTAGASCAR
eukprot:SAG31_NODE_153_length_22196_cov_24.963570_17_plen_92_part_00